MHGALAALQGMLRLEWLLPHHEPAVWVFHLQLVQKAPVSCSGGAELCGALVHAPSFHAAEIQDYRVLRGCLIPPGWPRVGAGVWGTTGF